MTVQELRNALERKKGEKHHIEQTIEDAKYRIKQSQKGMRRQEKVRGIIQEVGLKTQEQLSYNVGDITTIALNAVFSDPYDLKLEFIERRNKTECDIFFARDDMHIEPFGGGGGVIDVAAFALRIASWSMQRPKTRNVLILDEPFKHLKGEQANRRMLSMVKEISSRLGVQIIMVSDERVSRGATIEAMDLLVETTIQNGVTKINIE